MRGDAQKLRRRIRGPGRDEETARNKKDGQLTAGKETGVRYAARLERDRSKREGNEAVIHGLVVQYCLIRIPDGREADELVRETLWAGTAHCASPLAKAQTRDTYTAGSQVAEGVVGEEITYVWCFVSLASCQWCAPETVIWMAISWVASR
jgi:hypothetical protein